MTRGTTHAWDYSVQCFTRDALVRAVLAQQWVLMCALVALSSDGGTGDGEHAIQDPVTPEEEAEETQEDGWAMFAPAVDIVADMLGET